jgi:hypothetical protein
LRQLLNDFGEQEYRRKRSLLMHRSRPRRLRFVLHFLAFFRLHRPSFPPHDYFYLKK